MVYPVASFCVFAGLPVNLGMHGRQLRPYVCASTYTRVHTPSSVRDSVCATHTPSSVRDSTQRHTLLPLCVTVSEAHTGTVHGCTRVMLCRSFTFYVCKSIHILGQYGPEWSFPRQDCITNPYVACFLTFLPFIFHALKLCPCGICFGGRGE